MTDPDLLESLTVAIESVQDAAEALYARGDIDQADSALDSKRTLMRIKQRETTKRKGRAA